MYGPSPLPPGRRNGSQGADVRSQETAGIWSLASCLKRDRRVRSRVLGSCRWAERASRDRGSEFERPDRNLFSVLCSPSSGKDQADRAISTGQLHALLRFHTRPIDVVVYHGSQARPGFEGGFPLRCFQRLSRPHLATRLCRWRDNRSTRGASIPVLSY